MLTIHEGSFLSDLSGLALREIEKAIGEGKRAYLIVPEQQTLIAEREAASRLPESAPRFFEVTNFPRIANTVFRKVGGVAVTYPDKTEEALLMWRALADSAHLLVGRKNPVSEGAVRAALAALGEMRALGVGADELGALAKSESLVGEGRLASKVHDLSVILSAYTRFKEEKFPGSAEDLPEMNKRLEADPTLLSDTLVFADGFTSFTEPQLKTLGLLVGRADVHVNLVLPKSDRDAFAYTETRVTEDRLLRLCDLAGVQKKREFSPDVQDGVSPLLSEILPGLWHTRYKIDKVCLQNKDDLRIFKARTPKDEADFIASDIARRVYEGASYADFAVVERQNASYAGILDRSLAEANIPFFFSRSDTALTFEGVKVILLALRAVSGNFARSDVIAYAKCGLSGLSPAEVDRFELYTGRWNVTGKRFLDPDVWNMNPAGMTERRPPDADLRLADIHRTRSTLMKPLADLARATSGKRTVKEHSDAVVKFLLSLGVEDALSRRAASGGPLASENARLFSVICDTLDRVVSAIGDFETDTRGYASLLTIAFGAVGIGRLPAHVDEVTVGQADMIRLSGKKHIYLVGVNEGIFPATPSDTSYFTEREKITLASLGLPTEPDADVKGARELFFFSRAFSAAKTSVTVLFAERSAGFKPQRPAPVIADLCAMTDGAVTPVAVETLPLLSRVYTPSDAMKLLPGTSGGDRITLRAALEGEGYDRQLTVERGDLFNAALSLTREATDSIYKKDMGLTQSRIDQFVHCPLNHFCLYVLKLDEGKRATFDALNVGNLVHKILEEFLRDMKMRGEETLTPEERKARVTELAKKYVDAVDPETSRISARREHLISLLRAAADIVVLDQCEDIAASRFKPAHFEYGIERNKEGAPEPVVIPLSDGTRAFVYGQIDRVDTFASGDDLFVRIIDYKTGSKTFEPEDLQKKQNLQMFLYLRAVTESESYRAANGGKRLIPAGVLYVNTALDGGKVDSPSESGTEALREAQKRKGMLLDNETSIGAMNPEHLPIRYNKDHTVDKNSSKLLYTEEGWKDICHTVEDGVRQVAESMKTGKIPASPLRDKKIRDVCASCSFKPICRNAGGGHAVTETDEDDG